MLPGAYVCAHPKRETFELRERSFKWALAAAAIAFAVLATVELVSSDRAVANNSCLASCQATRDNCRISTKNSPQCEQQFTRCLQGCRRK